MNALKKYAVFFKVTLEDKTAQFNQSRHQGLATDPAPQQIDEAVTANDSITIKVPGDNRYETFGKTLNDSGLSSDIWKSLDIQAGIPAIYPETSEKFLPHEINLPQLNAVNFKKGCYTGQEIIARMEYRGKLKNHLYKAEVETATPPMLNQDIYHQNDPLGRIVDFCQIGYNKYTLLVITSETDINNTLSLDSNHETLLTIK